VWRECGKKPRVARGAIKGTCDGAGTMAVCGVGEARVMSVSEGTGPRVVRGRAARVATEAGIRAV
jgi:hypothetical protein